jgi:predicted porin
MAGSADLFADTLADAENTGGFGIIGAGGAGFDLRVNNAIAYVSPSFSGLTVVGAIVPGNGGSTGPHNLTDAYSIAALYANGPLKANLAYEDHNKLVKEHAWKLNVGYTMGDLTLGATYEDMQHLLNVSGANSKNFLVSAAYGMGPITLAAQYGKRNPSGSNNNLTDTTVGVVYGLSKRTSTYIGYAHYKPEGASSVNALTMGLNHDF